ncbi:small subunit processome component 20 homolog [Eriocheir sinensis]|uniref:small subunit processome component 20 homolog n=1 Tax=Eriocheir sinensis TaxID=95602 RepID=UPI0021C580E0|nr:small subunit processome component 20 homolog [Eriocheir sinensis]XP_050735564.1 small subunit processome component 20 homolog [Eriocheir sinensis]
MKYHNATTPQRQAHRATNTFTFRGFGEKVRSLRVSGSKFLLRRPTTDEGEEATFLHQALLKARELNLTQAFQDAQNDLGGEVQSLAQLVHQEQQVADCLACHLAQPDTPALQPLLDMLVAFASDLPQEFYQRHFYRLLPVLVGQLSSREPERLEAVFLCIAAVLVVVQRYLRTDLPRLYHQEGYASLLSPAHPWYINELAAQTLTFVVRKAPGQPAFLRGALMGLGRGEGGSQGLGRLLAAIMKADVVQRLHSTAGSTLATLLSLLGEAKLPCGPALDSITYAVQQVAHHITTKHPNIATWQTGWSQDSALVWPTLWKAVAGLLPPADAHAVQHLQAVMQVVQAWVSFKQAVLVTDLPEALKQCIAVAQCQMPEEVGTIVCDTVTVLLTSPHHHCPSTVLHQALHSLLASPLTHSIKITFVGSLFDLDRFDTEVLPEVLLYLDGLTKSTVGQDMQQEVLATLATLVLKKQPPCKTGVDLPTWRPYPLSFSKAEDPIPALIEDRIRAGLEEDLSNLEEVALCLIVVAHVSPLDHQELAPYLSWALSLLLDTLTDDTQRLVENDRPAPVKRKGKARAEVTDALDCLDLNVKCDLPLATRRSLAILGVLVEAMVHILSREDFLACLLPRQLLEVVKKRPQYRGNTHFLRAMDLHLTVAQAEGCSEVMNEETLREVYSILGPCLASSEPQARLLVLHTFTLFPLNLPPPPENAEAVESVFEVMLKAESVAVTPWDYKNRLRYLSMIDADHVAPHLPTCGFFKEAPLLLLLGQLYINFKDIWEPALKAISGYAHSFPDSVFWPLWFSRLTIASHFTKQLLQGKEVDPDSNLGLEFDILEDIFHHVASHDGFAKVPIKPDHLNYRNLLWRAMAMFPGVCEARNRDLVPLMFTFLEEELYPADCTIAPTQDLTLRTQGEEDIETPEIVEEAQEEEKDEVEKEKEEEEEDEEKEQSSIDNEQSRETQSSPSEDKLSSPQPPSTPSTKKSKTPPQPLTTASLVQPRRAPIKSLCELLTVFSKFHNPRMVLHTDRLQHTYQQLLSHPLPAVQRLALDCLMSYGHAYLTAYKESLYSILDDRSFKHALTLFSIDGSEQSVEEQHRSALLPCLLRILYGKMYHKTGPNTAGRAKVAARKAVVLRFLAGAREAELDTFLDLSFEALAPHLEGSPAAVVARTRTDLDLQRVVPPSRLQSALTTVQNFVEKIGNLLKERVPFLLKVTLYVASMTDALLARRAEMSPRHVSFLKHLRQLAQRQVEAFFRQFVEYSWSADELEAVFEAAVWPGLERLPDEGLSSPSPLLGLFRCWAQHAHYMPLLAWHQPQRPTLTPLPYVVRLLQHPKCGSAVATSVLTLVEDLLTLPDPAPEEGHTLPPSPHMVVVERRPAREADGDEGLMNYGTALLTPHLDPLLQSLGTHLAKLGQGQAMATRDLTILSSLTRWVTSKDVSQELLSLIVPVLAKRQVKKEEKVAQLLAACCHLLGVVDDPQQHLRPLLSLLGWVGHRQAREHLCQALSVLASQDPALQQLALTASDLNAWSSRAVEEVDFERRLARYRALTPLLTELQHIDLPLSLLLVHHNMFVLQQEEDAALRDVAALCLTQLVDACARLQETEQPLAKQVVVDRLLPLVRTALRGEREVVRLEAMAVLRHIVHTCSGLHPHLTDLHQLADTTDEDSDFFSNMRHIQRHRRARALTRLVDKLAGSTLTLAPQTLTDYVVPMASVYLFKDEYVSDEYLMGSCVATLGAVAKCLSWFPYQRLLRYYLSVMLKGDLKHLRLGLKVLDAILEAFHEEVEECALPGRARLAKRQGESRARQWKKGKGKKGKKEGLSKQSLETEEKEKKSLPDIEGSDKEQSKGEDTKMEVEEEEKDEEEEMNEEEEGEEEGKKGKDTGASSALTRPQKVYRALVTSIIPQLQRTLGNRTRAETEHKLNRSKIPEDEDIKRIPLAFALIKLLKKMPRSALNANVNSVLMKLITFLKCKAEGIREEARNMLVKVMVELGGHYLPWLVNDLRSILTRGFQTHVLVYTLHAVLSQLRPSLEPGHVDACMTQLVEVCKEDILGQQAEEKKVSQITTKVKEARSDRGYDILRFTAEFMSGEGLREVVLPLREVLAHTQDRAIVAKMARCLTRVAGGLERNQNVTITQKSVFVYGILTEKLPELTNDAVQKPKKGKIERPDSFLLPPEPKRIKVGPKTSLKATAHILVEFALQLLCSLMRRGQLLPSDSSHVALLDPYVPLMTRCINSDHPEVSIQTLKCVNWLIKFPLPSLQKELKKICGQMFVVLHKYASPELAHGKLYDLVQLSFKTLAVVVRNVETYMLTEEEVEVLLGYVSGSLEDSRQQQTAFSVLQAVLARKMDSASLHQLLARVKEMSITSPRQYPLQQARVTYHTYLLTYPMKPRRITSNIFFFLDNIAYPVEEGRLSAATMISAIVANFPAKLITRSVETSLWFKVSEQLMKEHSRAIRALLHKILRALFERSTRREMLIDLCLKLMVETEGATPDYTALQVASKSLSAFLDVPVKLMPKSLLSVVLPRVVALIHPARYITNLGAQEVSSDIQAMDTSLVALLEVLGKLVGAFLTHAEWSTYAKDELWENVRSHLSYPHLHVRLSVASLVGQLLAAHPVEGESSPPLAATPEQARELAVVLCELLRTQAGSETQLLTQLSLAAVRNLIYLIRHSVKVPLGKRTPKTEDCDGKDDEEQHGEGGESGEEEEETGESILQGRDTKHIMNGRKQEKENMKDRLKGGRKSQVNFTQTSASKRRKNSVESEEEEENEMMEHSDTEVATEDEKEPHIQNEHKDEGEKDQMKGEEEEKDAAKDSKSLVSAAVWVLYRVGNMAYEELKVAGSERTVTREALLNLMAGLLVVAGPDAKAPRLLTYIIKHLARELTDEHLPDALKERTREVANLVKEKVGVETYTRHLTAAQTALARKRLDRRAHELQQKVVNPHLAHRRKKKKQEALKESRKRRIAERKGKSVKGGKGSKDGKATKDKGKSKKPTMMGEVLVKE